MDAIEQIIELYGRGEVEAAIVMIDARPELVDLMERQNLDHGGLVDYLIKKNAEG